MLPSVQTSSPRHSLSSRNKVQNASTSRANMIGPHPNFLDKLPRDLFYVHLLLITALIAFLAIWAALFPGLARNFNPRTWYAITLSTTALSGLSALSYQELVGLSPSKTFKATFWLSPLLTLTWTMQIIKNMMQVAVSHVKYMQFACGVELDFGPVVKGTARNSMGSICAGSILVPSLTAARAAGRVVGSASGDSDEFMFSCAGCCMGASSRAVAYGNRWGFVHVGVYGKGILRASADTWEMFGRAGMEGLIDRDLTSSFCFLCGVAGGAVSGLVGGVWALFVHGRYATEVCVYTFLVGYFTNRVAMAWIQASVMAYYVAYAENPQSQQFDDTIPAYIRQHQRSQV
ncbi:Plasma-membrane choline transporter family protein [Striga hermonthica]|uniref:Choline transporter-like protein n=1 Tax=Striga hermonthica TaxID=68872 RepID=A0A9N7ML55_STRHE|nr:Plasma-membrane choline transporter family protein [Striga hermonthica]